MKKIIVYITLLLASVPAATQAQSCCSKPSDNWHSLAMNVAFKESHLPPAPFEYSPAANSSMIHFETLDGKKGNAFYIPADQPTNKVLIIFHEWWGLNDYIKKEAEKWSKILGSSVDVYAIDLYDGQVTDNPDIASKLASGLDPKRGSAIIKGLLSTIGRDRQIVTLGWCMGGAWSFTATILAEKQATGCVMYYGFPEKEDKNIRTLQTDVLYIWGSQDKFIQKAFVDDFGKKVVATGHKFDFHAFDAVHAFANPSNPKYDAVAAVAAEKLAVKFIKDKFLIE